MREIHLLSQETIDQIAAGEVVERPSSVVKELVENAMDAGAGAITVEIRDGGISLIRITDNGEGIAADQIRTAFLRHATSKLEQLEDLASIHTMGFRGEALSSICAVSMTEMITKTPGSLTGVRYRIEGGVAKKLEQIGAPEGTTILVRNLFYNVPARKKFLKSPSTEAGYVCTLVERLAMSHPDISFRVISGGQTKLHTSGNGSLRDVLYAIYGRETALNLLEVEASLPVDPASFSKNGAGDQGSGRQQNTASQQEEVIRVHGVIGKPVLSRGNRNFENTFVNGRYIRSSILMRAIEEGFGNHLMQHRYPFAVLMLDLPGSLVDVNVHPAKLEVRFSDGEQIFRLVQSAVAAAFSGQEMIVKTTPESAREERQEQRQASAAREEAAAKSSRPEPFEQLRKTLLAASDSPYQPRYPRREHASSAFAPALVPAREAEPVQTVEEPAVSHLPQASYVLREEAEPRQMDLVDAKLLAPESRKEHKIVGQVFQTYWIVEFRNQMYIIDQHAAHEKVNYEKLKASFARHAVTSQQISPPLVCTLTPQEETLLEQYRSCFEQMGFEVEHFGGHDYQICAVPDQLLQVDDRQLFLEILDSLEDLGGAPSEELFRDRLATKACKMSVKGGDRLDLAQADALIGELLKLENPYQCPHGRPTIISMSKADLEKKFKRIV